MQEERLSFIYFMSLQKPHFLQIARLCKITILNNGKLKQGIITVYCYNWNDTLF